jgi:uncharacterized membrane protein
MRLNAPKKIVWLISLIVGIVAIVGHFTRIPVVTDYNYWLLLFSYVLIMASTFIKGL